MINRDSQLSQSIFSNMAAIMNSPEHKQLFSKKAQANPAPAQDVDLDHDPTKSVSPGAVAGKSPYEPKPSATDVTTVDGQMKALRDAISAKTRSTDSSGQTVGFTGLSQDEKDASAMANAYLSHALTSEQAEKFQSVMDKISKDPKYSAVFPEMSVSVANNEAQNRIREQSTNSTAALLSTMVKVADYLGNHGYIMSEALADNLINSIVVEAEKDMKKDKAAKKQMKAEKKAKKADKKAAKKAKKDAKKMEKEKAKMFGKKDECEDDEHCEK